MTHPAETLSDPRTVTKTSNRPVVWLQDMVLTLISKKTTQTLILVSLACLPLSLALGAWEHHRRTDQTVDTMWLWILLNGFLMLKGPVALWGVFARKALDTLPQAHDKDDHEEIKAHLTALLSWPTLLGVAILPWSTPTPLETQFLLLVMASLFILLMMIGMRWWRRLARHFLLWHITTRREHPTDLRFGRFYNTWLDADVHPDVHLTTRSALTRRWLSKQSLGQPEIHPKALWKEFVDAKSKKKQALMLECAYPRCVFNTFSVYDVFGARSATGPGLDEALITLQERAGDDIHITVQNMRMVAMIEDPHNQTPLGSAHDRIEMQKVPSAFTPKKPWIDGWLDEDNS